MMIRVNSFVLIVGISALWAGQAISQERQPSPELVVFVNPAAKIKSMSMNELARALRGRDRRIRTVGIQRKFYSQILKEFLKTSPGNFEREWLTLISKGRARAKPLVTESAARLIGLVKKNKRAMVILNWTQIEKKPAEMGVKLIRIGGK